MKTEKARAITRIYCIKWWHSPLLLFFAVVLFTALLGLNRVAAKTMSMNKSYLIEAGYLEHKIRADFSLAVQAYKNEEYIYAARLLRILIRQGNAKAKYLLATQYDSGLGVAQDKAQAFVLYQQAARAGITAAYHHLALFYVKGVATQANIHSAVYWWKKAAQNGDTDAQYNLGVIYTAGHGAIEPDLQKALKWWRMAAKNGDAVAQFNLGALYANGIGVSNRTCEASRWWKKSAASGFAQAKMALAVLETKQDYAICH